MDLEPLKPRDNPAAPLAFATADPWCGELNCLVIVGLDALNVGHDGGMVEGSSNGRVDIWLEDKTPVLCERATHG